MKANRFAWTFPLLFLGAIASQLSAEQGEAYRKVFEEFKAKAENGNSEAQFSVGAAYAEGIGVAKDATEAVKWYRKAAEQANADAQFSLGWHYGRGEGVGKNLVEAAKWLGKAAVQGEPYTQNALGACYYNGEGVPKDRTEAAKWFLKATQQGNAQSQKKVAYCFAKGIGVLEDIPKAAKWYRKAAEHGDADAQNELAKMYYEGEGVSANYVEAYKWVLLAAANGSEPAKHGRLGMERGSLTREQIAEGQRLAAEFKPSRAPELGASFPPEGIVDSSPVAGGTGFFITADGFLVTNEHVVNEATQIRLTTSAGFIAARVLKVDAANDLALLKAE